MQPDRQKVRHADRKTDTQIQRQTDRKTDVDKQADIQREKIQTNRKTYRQIENRQKESQRQLMDRQTDLKITRHRLINQFVDLCIIINRFGIATNLKSFLPKVFFYLVLLLDTRQICSNKLLQFFSLRNSKKNQFCQKTLPIM